MNKGKKNITTGKMYGTSPQTRDKSQFIPRDANGSHPCPDNSNKHPNDIRDYYSSVTLPSQSARTSEFSTNANNHHSNYNTMSQQQQNIFKNQQQIPSSTKQQQQSKFVTINVSGRKFHTTIEDLEFYPNSTLGCKFYRDRYFDYEKDEYFLDRHIASFEVIFESVYIYKQPLLRPLDIHLDIFLEEIRYYRLPEDVLKRYLESEGLIKDIRSRRDINFQNKYINYKFWPGFRHNLWELFELPRSSFVASIIGWWSIIAIVLSIIVFCLETVKEVETACREMELKFNSTTEPISNWLFTCCRLFRVLDVFCVAWFILEFIIRLLAAPDLRRFFKSSLNIIDMLALLPYLILLILSFRISQEELNRQKYLTYVVRVIKVARAARVLKLSRYSRALRVLGKTLTTSSDVFFLLVCFHCMMALTFATLVYALDGEFQPSDGSNSLEIEGTEGGENPGEQHYHRVKSSVDALWWASVTLTTVGYGDIVPASTLAKVVGGVCACVAIISLALPVPVIVSNFNYLYNVDRDDLKINPEDLMEPDEEIEFKSLINPHGLIYEVRDSMAYNSSPENKNHSATDVRQRNSPPNNRKRDSSDDYDTAPKIVEKKLISQANSHDSGIAQMRKSDCKNEEETREIGPSPPKLDGSRVTSGTYGSSSFATTTNKTKFETMTSTTISSSVNTLQNPIASKTISRPNQLISTMTQTNTSDIINKHQPHPSLNASLDGLEYSRPKYPSNLISPHRYYFSGQVGETPDRQFDDQIIYEESSTKENLIASELYNDASYLQFDDDGEQSTDEQKRNIDKISDQTTATTITTTSGEFPLDGESENYGERRGYETFLLSPTSISSEKNPNVNINLVTTGSLRSYNSNSNNNKTNSDKNYKIRSRKRKIESLENSQVDFECLQERSTDKIFPLKFVMTEFTDSNTLSSNEIEYSTELRPSTDKN